MWKIIMVEIETGHYQWTVSSEKWGSEIVNMMTMKMPNGEQKNVDREKFLWIPGLLNPWRTPWLSVICEEKIKATLENLI